MRNVQRSATSARFVRATIRVVSLSIALASADLLIPVANAQRETAPAGVTNYTRVDATVACAGATPVQALAELKKNGFVSVINFRMPEEQGANIDEAKAEAAKVGPNTFTCRIRRRRLRSPKRSSRPLRIRGTSRSTSTARPPIA